MTDLFWSGTYSAATSTGWSDDPAERDDPTRCSSCCLWSVVSFLILLFFRKCKIFFANSTYISRNIRAFNIPCKYQPQPRAVAGRESAVFCCCPMCCCCCCSWYVQCLLIVYLSQVLRALRSPFPLLLLSFLFCHPQSTHRQMQRTTLAHHKYIQNHRIHQKSVLTVWYHTTHPRLHRAVSTEHFTEQLRILVIQNTWYLVLVHVSSYFLSCIVIFVYRRTYACLS